MDRVHVPVGGADAYITAGGGATSLTELTDVTGEPAPGYSPVADQSSQEFPLTRVTTQEDLDKILAAVAAVEWHDLELQSGFTNLGGEFAPLRYRLTLNNVVYLEGIINRAEAVLDTNHGLPIAQLPPECSPGLRLMFDVQTDAQNPARVDVHGDGLLTFEGFFAGTANAHSFTLCGISFSVGGPLTLLEQALAARFGE